MKLVTDKFRFKSGGPHEKHVVATWNVRSQLSICLWTQGKQEIPVSRWPVCVGIIVNDEQQDANILAYLFMPNQLYMFLSMSSPIIRST